MIVIEDIPDSPQNNDNSIVQKPEISVKDMYKEFIGEPIKSNFAKAMLQKEITESTLNEGDGENSPEKKAFYKHLREITKVQDDGHHDWLGMLCKVCNVIPKGIQKNVCRELDEIYGHDHDYEEIDQYAVEYGFTDKPYNLFGFLGEVYESLPKIIINKIMDLK